MRKNTATNAVVDDRLLSDFYNKTLGRQFYILPEDVISQFDTWSEQRVYLALISKLDPSNYKIRECSPTISELCGITGMGRREVQRALRELESKDWIAIHPPEEYSENGYRRENLYQIYRYVAPGIPFE